MSTLRVTVKPNSKKGPLVEQTTAGLVVYVREPATEGKANVAVQVLLAQHLGISKSRVTLKSGHTAKIKTFEITD